MSIQNKPFLPKIVAVLGTTASGKTRLGVLIASRFEGEIVSADSRQVYKGMDIGTGKDLKEYIVQDQEGHSMEIPYHLIDMVRPDQDFSLAQFQKEAYRKIDDILSRKKLPVVVGGTGLYAQAIIEGYNLSSRGRDHLWRREAEDLSAEELFLKIRRKKPDFASKINPSDRKNKIRLIRYWEVLNQESSNLDFSAQPRYDSLVLGLTHPFEDLEKRIYNRLSERLDKEGMVEEVRRLQEGGLSWKRLESFGLEYKWIALYLQGKIDYPDMKEQLYTKIRKFAKKQLTWLRRWEKQGRKVNWVKSEKEALSLVDSFLQRKN